MDFKDTRLRQINEILNGIKVPRLTPSLWCDITLSFKVYRIMINLWRKGEGNEVVCILVLGELLSWMTISSLWFLTGPEAECLGATIHGEGPADSTRGTVLPKKIRSLELYIRFCLGCGTLRREWGALSQWSVLQKGAAISAMLHEV